MGLVGTDTLLGVLARDPGENVGSYAIGQGTLANSNYTITFVPADFAITAAPVTVTADAGQSKVYGAADPTLTYQSVGLVGTDTLLGVLARDPGENVGSYAIGQGSLANSNYTITFVPADFTITAAPVTVTADAGQSKVYGTSDPTLTYHAVGLVGTDTLSGVLARDPGENVGSYAIGQGSLANSNYTITFVPADFTITAHGVTVTADAGQSKVYGAADPTLTYQTVGLVGTDTLLGVLARDPGENVGSYAIGQGTLSSSNYTITFVPADFAITAAPVTVTADAGQSKVYGAADPTLTYQTVGLVSGDHLSGQLGRVPGENVGSYAIGQGTLANSNYTITFVPADFAITAAPVTVTADAGQSKVYGAADPTLTYHAVGLVGTDTLLGVLARDPGENVGSYAISQGTLSSSNYTITFVPADFAITAAPVTVTADAGQSKVYGTADPTLTYQSVGLVGTDTLSGALGRVPGENVGSYAIGQGSLANSNYTITFVPADFAITAAPVTVTADAGQSKVYGTSDPTLTYHAVGLVGTDTLLGVLARDPGENVGSYAISQGTLSELELHDHVRAGRLCDHGGAGDGDRGCGSVEGVWGCGSDVDVSVGGSGRDRHSVGCVGSCPG